MNKKEMAELITKVITSKNCTEERRKEILATLCKPLEKLSENSLKELDKELENILGADNFADAPKK